MNNFGKFSYSDNPGLPLLIFGVGELARLASIYFENDSPYKVAGYLVDSEYMPKASSVFGKPVWNAEDLGTKIEKDSYSIFVAFSGVGLSYARSTKVEQLLEKGFHLASYVSSHAFAAPDAKIDSNVMIFENNTIQSEVEVGQASVIWSGNHVGHQTKIMQGCFISSHVCIGGGSIVGHNSYLGMNSTIRDKVIIGPNTVVGANSYVSKNFPGNGVVFGSPAKLIPTIDPLNAV